jgi:hypothetical protein
MPMQAESLEVLEKASVAPAQARAIVRAIEIEIAGAKDTLATKHDVLGLRQDFEVLRRDFDVFRAEIRGEMSALAAALRTEMAKQGAELRAEMHRMLSNHTRQMYLALLGQMTVMLGFCYFFLMQVR